MSLNVPLESLSATEKLHLLELIWTSLCQNPADVPSPEWQKEILAERSRRLESGEASLADWDEAEERLLKLGQ